MKKLFISDLHLDPARPDIQACFDQFIKTCLTNKNTIHSLYILGDLFEFWIGDDASIPVYKQPISQLKQLSDIGIQVHVMHGNRDFLMGSGFEKESGCQLIPDLYTLSNKGEAELQSVLLSHGDIFCSDDKDYMTFRKMVRDPTWQTEFLSRSISERLDIAKNMRQQSKQQSIQKNSEITDVNQQTVEKIMSEHSAHTLIHGHTHRPATHTFTLHKQTAKRIVLPDWNPDAKVYELCFG